MWCQKLNVQPCMAVSGLLHVGHHQQVAQIAYGTTIGLIKAMQMHRVVVVFVLTRFICHTYLSCVPLFSHRLADSNLPQVAIIGIYYSVPSDSGWINVQSRKSVTRKQV